jgi:cell pole-organizing protein PopZ
MTIRDIPNQLQSLYAAVEDALMAAEHARGEAKKLKLEGTGREIARAAGDLRGVINELERRDVPELAAFTDGELSRPTEVSK